MHGISTYIHHKQNVKCREIYHTLSVWENNVSFGESYKKTTGVYVKYMIEGSLEV